MLATAIRGRRTLSATDCLTLRPCTEFRVDDSTISIMHYQSSAAMLHPRAVFHFGTLFTIWKLRLTMSAPLSTMMPARTEKRTRLSHVQDNFLQIVMKWHTTTLDGKKTWQQLEPNPPRHTRPRGVLARTYRSSLSGMAVVTYAAVTPAAAMDARPIAPAARTCPHNCRKRPMTNVRSLQAVQVMK